MKRRFARLLASIIFAVILGFAFTAHATTVTANSCSQSDVQAAIASAGPNGTVIVPAGSCIWSLLTIKEGLTLQGAGAGSTVITIGSSNTGCDGNPIPANGSMVCVMPDLSAITGSQNIKITGFTFNGNNSGYGLVWVYGSGYNASLPYRNIIIGNNTFENTGTTGGNGNTCIYVSGQVRGVVYNNIFDRCEMPWRVFGNGDTRELLNSAFVPFSYGSSDSLYFEDNTIQYSTAFNSTEDAAGWIESGQGGRWVVRFNTWNMANASGVAEFWDVHGDQNFQGGNINGQTSTMISEFYHNTITNAPTSSVYRWVDHRGGWGIFFDNSFSGGEPGADIEVNQYAAGGASTSGCYNQIVNPDGTTYSGPDLTVANTYFINNTVNGTLTPAVVGGVNGCGVVENGAVSPYGTGVLYGWWNQQTSFNGTVGVGRGLKASMPSTCTTGVGYWATDEGSWNTKIPANTSGQFYKCTATNTWTLYYTPYTYPDPLRGGATQATLTSPSNLVGVVN